MRTFFGYFLIFVGVVSLFRYKGLGNDAAETFGALLGVTLIAFLPAYFLLRKRKSAKL